MELNGVTINVSNGKSMQNMSHRNFPESMRHSIKHCNNEVAGEKKTMQQNQEPPAENERNKNVTNVPAAIQTVQLLVRGERVRMPSEGIRALRR